MANPNPYPTEVLDPDYDEGTMPDNVAELSKAVVGHKIVSAGKEQIPHRYYKDQTEEGFVLTLDNGKRVQLHNTDDCCAYTELDAFLLHPELVDHVIMGIGTTDGYSTWHIYADFGDILELTVAWSAGNLGYYGYGFDIDVIDIQEAP